MATTAATSAGERAANEGVNQRGAAHRERANPLRRVGGQPQAGHPAERHPGVRHALEVVGVEQGEHVGAEFCDRVRPGRRRRSRARRAVPARLEPQHAEVPRQDRHLMRPHVTGGADGVPEDEHGRVAGAFER